MLWLFAVLLVCGFLAVLLGLVLTHPRNSISKRVQNGSRSRLISGSSSSASFSTKQKVQNKGNHSRQCNGALSTTQANRTQPKKFHSSVSSSAYVDRIPRVHNSEKTSNTPVHSSLYTASNRTTAPSVRSSLFTTSNRTASALHTASNRTIYYNSNRTTFPTGSSHSPISPVSSGSEFATESNSLQTYLSKPTNEPLPSPTSTKPVSINPRVATQQISRSPQTKVTEPFVSHKSISSPTTHLSKPLLPHSLKGKDSLFLQSNLQHSHSL
jgi:hypothetical protein